MFAGAVTGYIDVAQLVLYAFWLFFAGLILYLRREDKREGYPLESDRTARAPRVTVQGFPAMPAAKVFRLPHGGTAEAPNGKKDGRVLKAVPVAAWPGAPLEPTGDPMLDGVGPAAYAERADVPDLTLEGEPRVVPMRVATDHFLATKDPDLRGFDVVCADGNSAGKVVDLWVDRSEAVLRYIEVSVGAGDKHALLPVPFARVDGSQRRVRVQSVLARHFANVPGTRLADSITLLEEDRIAAYFAGGHLYAEPSRLGPLL